MSTPSYVMSIGNQVLAGPVREWMSDNEEADCACMTTLPLPSGYNTHTLDAAHAKALLQSFSSMHLNQPFNRKAHNINLHLVAPTSMLLRQKDFLLQEIAASNKNIRVQSVHSSAAALCLAAFSSDIKHAGPNVLLTVDGPRGYCEWETERNGNKQRVDMLATSEGVTRVLIAEIGAGYVNVSVAEVERNDRREFNEEEEGKDEESIFLSSDRSTETETVHEQLTVRLMSTCGTSCSGWMTADIQFTAAQLAEVYAVERGDASYQEVFPCAPQKPKIAKPPSGGDEKKDELPPLPPLPTGLFPVQVPQMFLQFALPRLAQEITRPFLSLHLSSLEEGQGDELAVFRLRRLLWLRNMELETAFVAESLDQVTLASLTEIEQRLHQFDTRKHKRHHKNTFLCPSSPSDRLPSSIAEQLTWSPARPITPPQQPKKQSRKSVRRTTLSTGDLSGLVPPPPTTSRTLSGTSMSAAAAVKGSSLFSLTEAESSPSAASAQLDVNEFDLQEVYMSPFRPFFHKKICRQRPAGRNANYVEDLANDVGDLRSLLDGCIKKSLTKANVHIIGGKIGLNSPSRRVSRSTSRSTSTSTSRLFQSDITVDTDVVEPEGGEVGLGGDLTNGWKSSIEHEDVLQPPRIVLLHISTASEINRQQDITDGVLLSSSNNSCPCRCADAADSNMKKEGPIKETEKKSDDEKTKEKIQVKVSLVSKELPGVFSSIYKSLQTHSACPEERAKDLDCLWACNDNERRNRDSRDRNSDISRDRSKNSRERQLSTGQVPSFPRRTQSASHAVGKDSRDSRDRGSSASREQDLTNMCRREALRNVLLAELDDRSLYLGAKGLAASVLPSSSDKGITRIFDMPLNIGIRIVAKVNSKLGGDADVSLSSDNDQEGWIRSRVLWISGFPPQGCRFVQQPLVLSPPPININNDHFRLLDASTSISLQRDVSMKEEDLFYDEHIEKYHPSCRLLISDDEEDESESEGEEDALGNNSCWRDRPSFYGDGIRRQMEEEEEEEEEKKKKMKGSITVPRDESNLIGIGLKTVFSGGFDTDIQLGLHLHNMSDSETSTPTLLASELNLFPSNMLWSATETIAELPLGGDGSCKMSRCGSDDSYGSFLTEETSDRPSWESIGCPLGATRHILVEIMETVETVSGGTININSSSSCKSNYNSDKNDTYDRCDVSNNNDDRHSAAGWCLEVVQYTDSPHSDAHNTGLNVSKIYTLPFPESNHAPRTPVNKTLASYSFNLHIDALSGVVSCRLLEIEDDNNLQQKGGEMVDDTREKFESDANTEKNKKSVFNTSAMGFVRTSTLVMSVFVLVISLCCYFIFLHERF